MHAHTDIQARRLPDGVASVHVRKRRADGSEVAVRVDDGLRCHVDEPGLPPMVATLDPVAARALLEGASGLLATWPASMSRDPVGRERLPGSGPVACLEISLGGRTYRRCVDLAAETGRSLEDERVLELVEIVRRLLDE